MGWPGTLSESEVSGGRAFSGGKAREEFSSGDLLGGWGVFLASGLARQVYVSMDSEKSGRHSG